MTPYWLAEVRGWKSCGYEGRWPVSGLVVKNWAVPGATSGEAVINAHLRAERLGMADVQVPVVLPWTRLS